MKFIELKKELGLTTEKLLFFIDYLQLFRKISIENIIEMDISEEDCDFITIHINKYYQKKVSEIINGIYDGIITCSCGKKEGFFAPLIKSQTKMYHICDCGKFHNITKFCAKE